MISKLELNKIQENLIQVVDKSEYDYSVFPSKFSRENTVSINYLSKISFDSNQIKDICVSKHDNLDENVFEISEDGYYRINHIIVPTKEWLDTLDLENVVKYERVYFYMNDDVYEYNFKTKEAIKVDAFILLNVCDLNTTVFSSEEDFVLIYNIKNCLVDLINSKFSKFNCKESVDNLLNTQIEYLQMVYNVLDYYVSCGSLLEAETLLKDFSDCYNICKETKSKCNCI